MRFRRNYFLLGLLAVTLIVLSSVWYQISADRHVPEVQEGVLDLSGWKLEETGIVPLDGEWEFYPDVLLEPGQIRDKTPERPFIRVPGNWDGWEDNQGKRMNGKGAGTYRLVIRNAPADQTLAIAKRYVRFADKLYVDGVLAGQSGSPGMSRTAYEPRNSPYLVYFRPTGAEVELLLQAANFDFRSGGIFSSVELGLGYQMEMRKTVQSGLELMAVVVQLLFGLLFVYLYYRLDRDFMQLLYAAFFICYGLSIFTNGERLFLQLLPGVSFELAFKIKYMSVYAAPALVVVIGSRLMGERRIRLWLTVSSVLIFLYIAGIVVLPFRIYSYLQDVCFIGIMLTYVALAVLLLFQYASRRFDAEDKRKYQILIASVWMLFISSCVSILNSWNMVGLGLVNTTSLMFMLLLALLLIRQYVQAFASMQQLAHKLRVADQMKDEFLLLTSHELNTPLHGIMNVSKSLLASPLHQADEGQIREKLLMIRNTAYRMSGMVQDIIDTSRFKEGRLEITMRPVDLVPCISVLMEVFGFLANGKNVALTHRIAPGARHVMADESRLVQVFYNAIYYTLGDRGDKNVHIESVAENGNVRIWIRQQDRQEADQPHKEAQAGGREGAGGIGIGLSLAFELIELMGGEFQADETLGTLELKLPSARLGEEAAVRQHSPFLAEAAAASERSVPRDLSGRDSAASILVVTADLVSMEHLSSLLGMEGYRVLFARTDGEALSYIRGRMFDLVLIDVMLPEAGGFELCRLIRQEFSQVELPVLFMNALSSPAHIEACIAAGGSDFIARPLNAGEIRVRISALLATKRLIKEAAASEMAFLRSQIKPHFLYNALSTIMSLCYTDSARAGEMLGIFSQYLRILFQHDNTEETITLRKEMELVQAYVDIERERFGARLRVEIDVDHLLYDCEILPLMIEPLVENAIRHGVSKKLDGGTVKLTIQKSGDLVRIEVEDDGIGMTQEKVRAMFEKGKPGKGVGLPNMMRRLQIMSGPMPIVDSAPGVGTKVTMMFPLRFSP